MNRLTVLAATGLAGFAFAKGAAIAPGLAASVYKYGYELSLDGGGSHHFNAPNLTFKNTGNTRITGLSLTIGDTTRNFDAFFVGPSILDPADDLSFDLLTIDAQDHGLRSNVFDVGFTGFDEGDAWSGLLDIDKDVFKAGRLGTIEDARTVLFGNAGANAALTITFEDGFTLTGELPDDFNQHILEEATLSLASMSTAPGTTTRINRSRAAQQGTLFQFAQDVEDRFTPGPDDEDEPGPGPGPGPGLGPGPTPVVPTPAAAFAGLAMLGGLVLTRRR